MLNYIGWDGRAWYKLTHETHHDNIDEARKTLVKVYELHRDHKEGPASER